MAAMGGRSRMRGGRGRIPRLNPMGRIVRVDEVRSRDTVELARWLLGKTLVRTRGAKRLAATITEVEAYDGERDLACHASRGRTPRTDVMYGAGGVWYVYFVYGMHSMLNLVTGPEGYPAAVLIRGLDAVSGPGRLTRAFSVDLRLNRAVASPESGLHLEDPGILIPRKRILATPRIGVDYAGPVWSAKPWRFRLH